MSNAHSCVITQQVVWWEYTLTSPFRMPERTTTAFAASVTLWKVGMRSFDWSVMASR
jgi:hypothetical protein